MKIIFLQFLRHYISKILTIFCHIFIGILATFFPFCSQFLNSVKAILILFLLDFWSVFNQILVLDQFWSRFFPISSFLMLNRKSGIELWSSLKLYNYWKPTPNPTSKACHRVKKVFRKADMKLSYCRIYYFSGTFTSSPGIFDDPSASFVSPMLPILSVQLPISNSAAKAHESPSELQWFGSTKSSSKWM